ncbi:MAG TPA: carbohydrate binding domain-containing protein [Candidatus Saccharimonadales bacterium]|nr:carbohydrate binding domain-containing protein [Candidatus Saccharimonadales bacterium]
MTNIKLRILFPSKSRAAAVVVFALSALLVASLIYAQAEAAVGINKQINFQGKVVNANGTNVSDASYTFRFRIYTAATGDAANACSANTCVWEESKSLSTVNGIFQTSLGDTTVLPGSVDFNSDNLYLGVVFNGDTEMSPRIRLSAVPYAFNADKLDGLDASQLVQLSPGAQQSGAINVSGNITSGGTVAAGTIDASAAGALTLGGANATGLTLAKNTTMGGGFTLSLQGTNALSLGSTTASGGIIFKDGTINDRSVTLSTVGLAASYTLNLPPSAPTAGGLCLQTASASTTNLAFDDCVKPGKYIALQSSTPGTAETGNFNITGVGIASTFNAGTFDTASAMTLNIGTANAAGVTIARAGVATSIGGTATVGGDITITSGAARTLKVAVASSGAGNSLALAGGAAAAASNANGGNILLSGGIGDGTGVKGVVLMDTAAFSTTTNTSCSVSCTVAQNNVDNASAIIVSAAAATLTITVPDPTNLTAGRLLYITGGNGSNDFALDLNSGATLVTVAMRANSTATLIWNGSDWTAAGASSSTTLQAAYDNTLASAGGAEILLNNTATSNGLTIRNSQSNPIIGSVFEVQSSIATNLLSVQNLATEYVLNGGAESSSTFGTTWLAIGAGSVFRNTTASNVGTGQAAAEVNSAAALDTGVRIKLSTGLDVSTKYQVSFTGKLSSGSFTSLIVRYSRNGGTSTVPCSIYSTQTLVTTGWSKVTCVFTTDGTAATDPYIQIQQSDSTARTFYIDNVSVTLSTSTSTPPNVQIGGGLYGGAVTVLTLDRASSPPVANGNDVYYGSMYYDTTTGRIQCYEADGWGACGSAPDEFVNLTPEYAGAVLNGVGVGTLTADFCSNQSSVLAVNTTLCGTGQALNYYKWTSPQATQQTYSVYLSYQLPGGFKEFQSDTTIQLTARTDSTTNGAVTYEMFRSEGGTVSACGTETTVTTAANAWQTVGINGNERAGCGFSKASANSFVIFKINVKAQSNANVYVGTLSFTMTNQ